MSATLSAPLPIAVLSGSSLTLETPVVSGGTAVQAYMIPALNSAGQLDSSFVTGGSGVAGVTTWNTRSGSVVMNGGDVTTALGYTPLSAVTSAEVVSGLGFTPYDATNPNGYITSVTSGGVVFALGFTPYNVTNPNGYIASITAASVTSALGYTPLAITAVGSGIVFAGGTISTSGGGGGGGTTDGLWWYG